MSDEETQQQTRTPVTAQAEPMDGAMRTGEGADDEPEMTIGDKHTGDPPLDTDGDGKLTVDEAEELLGGSGGDDNARQGTSS
jgi:hypothetical protein